MNVNGCIAHPCEEDRAAGSGFCPLHKEEHSKSLWSKAWRAYQKEIVKVGIKNAIFSPPKRKDTEDE